MRKRRGAAWAVAGATAVIVGSRLPWHLTLFQWRGGALDPQIALALALLALVVAFASAAWAWARLATFGVSSGALCFMLLTYLNGPGDPGAGKALALVGAIVAIAGGAFACHDAWLQAVGSSAAVHGGASTAR